MVIVYCATSPSGKRYIGMTTKYLEERIMEHAKQARIRNTTVFHRALNKHGPFDFIWEILAFCKTLEEALKVEKLFIHMYRTQDRELGYNLTEGGEGRSGSVTSEETKQKQRDKMRNPIVDQDGNVYESCADAARKLGINEKCVQRVVAGTRKHTHGMVFKKIKAG